MGNRYRMVVVAAICFLQWWTLTQRCREVEQAKLDLEYEQLCTSPW